MNDPRSPAPRNRTFAAYVAFAERNTGKLLGALLLLMFVALSFAVRLDLHTEISELLPDHHPAVIAFRRISGRQKSASGLVLLIHGSSREQNLRFISALRPELEKAVPAQFSNIDWKPDTEVPTYANRWKWLYAEQQQLDDAEALLDRIISDRASPLAVDIEGDPEAELKELREKLNKKLPVAHAGDYFEQTIDGQSYFGVMLWRQLDGLGTSSMHDMLADAQQLVKRVDPHRFGEVTVEYTGAVAQAVDEQNGIIEDVTFATALCLGCVLLAIYSYFRRIALLWVIGAPAVLGLLLSLMLAALTVHYLNANTAFLISIILGNGINSPIVLLGRYGEERQAGRRVSDALGIAMSASVTGIGAAVAAASVAYGCLLWTTFRGFNQFGLIGGAGMLLVGLCTYLLVPPLVIFGERRWPGAFTPRPNLWHRPFAWLGGLAARRPIVLALVATTLVGLAAVPLYRWARDPLEWNFENLRSEDSPATKLWPKMEKLGMGDMGAGHIGNNGVLLVDKPEQADPVAQAMKKQDAARGKEHVLKEVRTINSMLPPDQAEKLETLTRIRRKIDRHVDMMSADERREVEAWRPPDYLRALTTDDLPRQVREAFTEVDGQRGRLVGIDADHTTYYDWNGHDLLRMSKSLTVDALGQTWVAASIATVFAGMLETIIADGPRVTLAALAGVTILVLAAFGLRGALPVLISIAVGVIWLGGLAGVIKLKINFMNFVALPITLGVGADYAANIWARMRQEGGGRIRSVISETGSAVALCSLTTIIGYSSLLLSRNRALRSFGLLADLGELTCLAAALVALPALAKLFARRPPSA